MRYWIIYLSAWAFFCCSKENPTLDPPRVGYAIAGSTQYVSNLLPLNDVKNIRRNGYWNKAYSVSAVLLPNNNILFKVGQNYFKGLDGSLKMDFHIASIPEGIELAIQNDSVIVCNDTLRFIDLLKKKEIINNSLNWESKRPVYISYYEQSICNSDTIINGSTGGFMGIREINGADTSYGWISIRTKLSDSLLFNKFYTQ